MVKKKSVKILFVVLGTFIIQFFSINSYATSTAPAISKTQVLSGGGGGSTPTPGNITAGGDAITAGNSLMPDSFSGTFSYSIPIEVPKGRKGMDPGLALTYRSSSGNGWVGVGWDLEIGAIERNARFGVDLNGSAFVLRKAGSAMELVAVNSGEYRAKIEGGFNRIRELAASDGRVYWEVTDKTGVRFLYGQTAASRQDDPSNANNIFKWCLDQVIDTHGNYMILSYFKDQGQIYIDRIDYAGNVDGTPTTNYIKFYRESRISFDAPAMYTTNFSVTTAYRLKTIDVIANGNRVRAYQLTYQYSTSAPRSLLTRVQQFGNDATLDASGTVTGGSALPAYTFVYEGGSAAWAWTVWNGPTLAFPLYNECFTGDLNGNGEMNFWCETAASSGVWNIATLTSGAWATTQSTGPAPSLPVGNQCFTGDFNGDGKMDMACYTGSGGNWAVSLSTGSNFQPQQTWTGPAPGIPIGDQCFTSDLNGDGKADLVCYTESGGNWAVSLSTGSNSMIGKPLV